MASDKIVHEIEKDLHIVKSQLAALAFLIRGLQSSDGGDELYGLGLILEDHWRILERTQERVVDLAKKS